MTQTINSIKNCTGCGACLNICPVKAIYMEKNSEGFLYPTINEKKCTKCGLCLKKCPSANPCFSNFENPKCFAMSANDDLRKESSSGAIFPLLAEYILNNGGYVCGATWNDDNLVEHVIISNKDDLHKLKSSKYLQSDTKFVFSEIKRLLDNDKLVLFSGTPCQVAGLKACLNKDYDNLLTIDIVCHGVPSPMVYKKYISEIISEKNEKVLYTNFRDKRNGWNPYLIITTKTSKKSYSLPAKNDSFMNAFLKNMCLRNSCSKCSFAKLPRQGDITLGDFWGIDKYSKKLNDQKGLSMVLINSSKGEQHINNIKNDCKLFKNVPIHYAIKGNPCLTRSSIPHIDRNSFFERFEKMSLSENVAVANGQKYDCGILNFWFSNNYGALLTCYALQETIKDFGFNPRVINYISPRHMKKFKGGHSDIFSKKYLLLTQLCKNKEDLKQLNKQTDTFIVGSDQVWRYRYFWPNGANIFQLNFAQSDKKKIACAASFGTDTFEGNQRDTQLTKFFMQQFDNISVREDDGVNICKEIFDVEATHILDPVFLIQKNKWDYLIKNSELKNKNFIVSYVLDKTNLSSHILNKAKIHFNNHNHIDMTNGFDGCEYSVEDWLYAIKNCEFFITDSFHGVCFAIIFNKPFICIGNINRGFSRFSSLLKIFNLQKNCILEEKDIKDFEFYYDIDFDKVNNILNQKIVFSKEWILNALKSPLKSKSPSFDIYNILETQIDALNFKITQILKYPKYKRKYIKYKLLKPFVFGKLRKKYKQKKKKYKQLLKQIKNYLK